MHLVSIARKIPALLVLTFPLTSLRAQPVFFPPLPVAQIPAELKTAFATVLGVIMLVGFIKGTISVISGASKMRHGDPDGKMAMLGGALMAGSALIMGAFFTIFGLGDGILRPSF